MNLSKLGSVVKQMENDSERASWEPSEYRNFSIKVFRGEYAFDRTFIERSEKHPSGITLEEAKAMAGKNGRLWVLTTKSQRVI